MIIEIKKIINTYKRVSKLGIEHNYKKIKNVIVLRCDNCGSIFERDVSSMSPKRRSNAYFHVCENCDTKRFAQRKGVERRFIWDRHVDSTDDISKI